jgi:hypothetical protein
VNRILCDFAGRWKVERDVTPANRPAGQFLGGAEWTNENGLMHYEEGGSYRSWGTRRWWWSRGIFGIKSSTSTLRMDGFSTKCPHWAGWLRIGVTLTNMMRAMISQTGRNGTAHGGSGGRARTTHCTAATQNVNLEY